MGTKDGARRICSRLPTRPVNGDSHVPAKLTSLQTETYQVASNNCAHGHAGPLKVSDGGYFDDVAKDWIKTAVEYDRTTRTTADDVNSILDTKTNAYTVRI